MSEDPSGIVVRPTLKLEDIREVSGGHEPHGRGRETAALRGYNAELLADALLGDSESFRKWSPGPWADNYVSTQSGINCCIEVKTTIDQYPSQAAGRFRIWAPHHNQLLADADEFSNTKQLTLYLFVVYPQKGNKNSSERATPTN